LRAFDDVKRPIKACFTACFLNHERLSLAGNFNANLIDGVDDGAARQNGITVVGEYLLITLKAKLNFLRRFHSPQLLATRDGHSLLIGKIINCRACREQQHDLPTKSAAPAAHSSAAKV